MKIILTENIEKVGKVGQVINVKDGFARNYLLPQKLAIIANTVNLSKIEKIEADAKAKADKKNEEYRQLIKKVEVLTPTFQRRAELDGKLFGSVSEVDIANFLTENDIACTKSNIIITNHIKNVGEHEVKVSFTADIFTNLKVVVEQSE